MCFFLPNISSILLIGNVSVFLSKWKFKKKYQCLISVSLFVCMFPNFPRRWSRLSSDSPRSLMIPQTVCRITGFKGRSRRFLSKSENLEYLFGIHKPQKKNRPENPFISSAAGKPSKRWSFPLQYLGRFKKICIILRVPRRI